MKYIPADKLIAEIERRIGVCKRVTGDERNEEDMKRYYQGKVVALEEIRHLADSLQQEQPTRGYDEAYLNECIAKARKTWKGVDVDKYMDEMRGREQEQPEVDLEKLVNEEFASHCRTTEYGLVATYNRAELYQFIKRMALVFNARKED